MFASLCRLKVHIPVSKLEIHFSRGSGNGGQNLHASNARCLLKFNINQADWIPLTVRNAFLETFGDAVTARGNVLIVREDTRSAADNQKLALKQLQTMFDKAEEISLMEKPDNNFATEKERIESTRTAAQIQRYRQRTLESKRRNSEEKRNRKKLDWD
jgi:protein subunit release factor B